MLLEPEKDDKNDSSRSEEIRSDDCVDGQRANEEQDGPNKVTSCCCQFLQGQEKVNKVRKRDRKDNNVTSLR